VVERTGRERIKINSSVCAPFAQSDNDSIRKRSGGLPLGDGRGIKMTREAPTGIPWRRRERAPRPSG
jgi:hypothetical protein